MNDQNNTNDSGNVSAAVTKTVAPISNAPKGDVTTPPPDPPPVIDPVPQGQPSPLPQSQPSVVTSSSGGSSTGGNVSSSSSTSSTKKIVAGILGLVLLVGGVIAGVYVVKQNQDIRKEAGSIGHEGCISQKGFKVVSSAVVGEAGDLGYKPANIDPNNATFYYDVSDTGGRGGRQIGGETVRFSVKIENTSGQSQSDLYHFTTSKVVQSPKGTDIDDQTSIGEAQLSDNVWAGDDVQEVGYNSGNKPFTIPADPANNTLTLVGEWTPNNDQCGIYQIDMGVMDFSTCEPTNSVVVAAGFIRVTGCTATPTVTLTPTPTPGLTFTPVTPHITIGLTRPPTATPTVVATPKPGGQCGDIGAYTVEGDPDEATSVWSPMTDLSFLTLKAGDDVYFTVTGETENAPTGSFKKGEFTINNDGPIETTTIKQGSQTLPLRFYLKYTIPDDTLDFTVNARIYHSALGWY